MVYPDIFIDNNKEISGKNIVLDGLNAFLTNIGPDLADSIPKQAKSMHNYLDDKNVNSMFLADTRVTEALDIVHDLSNKTSVDYYTNNECL